MAYLKPNLSRLMDYHSNSQAGFNESTMKKKRKTFSVEEDQKLMQLVEEHGNKNWEIISSKIKTRSARQCRERWKFYLCPNVNRSPWTPEEDHILYENIIYSDLSGLCYANVFIIDRLIMSKIDGIQ